MFHVYRLSVIRFLTLICSRTCIIKKKIMATQETIICRLCLEICDDFEVIEGDMKNMLNVLLPNMDLTTVKQPVMCTSCTKELIKCFDFKTLCFHTYNYIVPFVNNKYIVKPNLNDVYLSQNESIADNAGDQDICGFCMNPVEKDSAICVDVEEGEVMSTCMIRECLPELDLGIIEKPVICVSCHGSLENCFHFVTMCLSGEEKIKNYRETLGINEEDKIELDSLLNFETRNVTISKVDYNLTDIYKMESIEENNKLAEIKTEISFCGENKVKMENLIEIEEQKFVHSEELEIKADDSDFNRFKDDITLPQPEVSTKLHMKQKGIMSNLEGDLSKPSIKQKPAIKNVSKVYQCESCLYQTKSKSHFNGHLLKHRDPSEIMMHKCNSCSFQTKYKDSFKTHLLKHRDTLEVTMYKCDSCSFQSKYKANLKTHLLQHKGPLERIVYKCVSCSFQTKYRSHLNTHLQIHKDPSERKMHKCDSCSFETRHKNNLRLHLLRHKDPSEVAMLKCDSCSYQTVDKYHLKTHLLIHKDPSEVAMLKCESCSYQTRWKTNLKYHLQVHKESSEVTMYKCDSCSFETIYKGNIKTHLLTHEGPSKITMHKCDFCSFQTKYKHNLRVHCLKHNDPSKVATYKCDICSFQTKYQRSLQRHLMKHK